MITLRNLRLPTQRVSIWAAGCNGPNGSGTRPDLLAPQEFFDAFVE
jgi:hypothetical protein